MWEIVKWSKALRQKGIMDTIKQWWTANDIKAGKLVGVDILGNKYYQNMNEDVLGRDRWVEYSHINYPKEPSHIPPEWHAWMHRMTDIPPSSPKASEYYAKKPSFAWKEHRENLTGTDGAYRPYNTAAPKVQEWKP